ncbi:hypothetical protein E4T52_09396 [Aureobasidium sp. EXF-3400]|nr:hypothetical protein E4T51_14315 [Aureobasidium sp. EXF-12344]KAI4775686.1 hypothetical protein E4T52_09396 [Aureobasidium sp. EXF-3400]
MALITMSRFLMLFAITIFALHVSAQTAATSPSTATAPRTLSSARNSTSSSTRTSTSRTSAFTQGAAPDVYLNVPELHVGRIELVVEKLSADLNLNAKVANLVQLNAGVQVAIEKVNITIAEVDAEVELVLFVLIFGGLGHLVDIVGRVFDSLDLNPLLISTIGNATSLVGNVVTNVVGAVDGLLGSITQGGKTLNFVVDNLGNIVQEVSGVSTIVGDYTRNMTQTGASKSVGQGLTQKEYSYSPLNALVDIVFNSAGQVVQAVVQKKNGGNSGSGSSGSGSNSTVSAASSPKH